MITVSLKQKLLLLAVIAVGALTLISQYAALSCSSGAAPTPVPLASPVIVIAAGQPLKHLDGSMVAGGCTTAGNDTANPPYCGSGVTDDSGCFQTAMSIGGDVQINAGHYCINTIHDSNASSAGVDIPNGRNIRCGSGTGSASDIANIVMDYSKQHFGMFTMQGTGSVMGCGFRGPNYNISPHPIDDGQPEYFIGMQNSTAGALIANNDFHGVGGFLAAIQGYGGTSTHPNVIEYNTAEQCGHYFTQISFGDYFLIDHNTLVDCNCCVEGTFTFPAPHITLSNGHSTYTQGTGWDWLSTGGSGSQNYVDMEGE